jgi:hypothetical protein
VPSTASELQPAIAVNLATLHEPGLPGGPRRINQNFDIEGLEPSILVYDLTFDIEDSSISIYEFAKLSFNIKDSSISNTTDIEEKGSISKNLRYR